MNEHTPGPWYLYDGLYPDKKTRCVEIRHVETQKTETLIAKPYNFTSPVGMANARLMAAAPEMADALIETCETCESSVCGGCSVGRALHKAGIIDLELWDQLNIQEEEDKK